MSKYVTLTEFYSYFPVTISGKRDDTLLQQLLDNAESEFERVAGSQFNFQSVTNEVPLRAWIDRNGLITLNAKLVAPVVSVSSVQYLVPALSPTWQTVGWDSSNGIFLPLNTEPPRPESWTVQILPTTNLQAYGFYSADDTRFRWSYTGGYSVIPGSLKTLVMRFARFTYAMREAPLGRLIVEPLGMAPAIADMPADLKETIRHWTRIIV